MATLIRVVLLGLLCGLTFTYQPYVEECVTGKYPPSGKPLVPTYVVNLDLPASQRWTAVMKDKGKGVVNLLNQFKGFLLKFGNWTDEVINLIDKDLGVDTLPQPFADEMKGIASATGLPVGEVVLYNLFYEVFTVCTSIVGQDPTGKLYHARNLDFGLFMGWQSKTHTWRITEALKQNIVNLDWQKGGKTVFKSVNFAGYVGIITAIKPDLFTFTMDERFNIDGGYLGILEWILGDRSGNWMGFLTRTVMEYAQSYSEAKSKLVSSPMLAPAYFILGGNKSGEATVVTRSRKEAVDVWDLDPTKEWYLLETNYDHWSKPFFLDNRRDPGNNCMKKMTQKNVSFAGLFNVLTSRPVLNKLTTYTALMQVNSGKLETYIQNCPDPCFPW